ncbi:hypothetical protein EXIGLDRAFT_695964 [Exidia glandulosa HHB12029]|uniref:Uncharacterized protein n=1 Tax=Exidia glandulosa HHB12029 TaxID=1314781 RepID=A0A165QGN8_EXIGL|nr:hypothetical protein EXIGLDRAFT_695964 [Exidia glandulosa HHB12029]
MAIGESISVHVEYKATRREPHRAPDFALEMAVATRLAHLLVNHCDEVQKIYGTSNIIFGKGLPSDAEEERRNLACGITNHEKFYMYRLRRSSCVKLDRPTVGQFLVDLRAHHDALCACGILIGDRVWLALSEPDGPGTMGHDTSTYELCGLDYPLERFSAAVAKNPGVYHLLVEGTPPAEKPQPPEQIQIVSEYVYSVFRIPGAQQRG